jgi:hypothetical protein
MNPDSTVPSGNEEADPAHSPLTDTAGRLSKAEADRLLEEKKKRNTSGLSWDEVADDDKKGWHQITDMGEGD